MKSIALLLLVGLCALTVDQSLCVAVKSSDQLPAVDYIDGKNFDHTLDSQRIFFREFVEKNGGETAEETANALAELAKSVEELVAGSSAEDKFNLMAQFDKSGLVDLQKYLQPMNDIVSDTPKHFNPHNLIVFLDTIKMFFGDNLEGFARGQVSHDGKLHAFLLEYGKSIVSYKVEDASKVIISKHSGPEGFLRRAVTHDLPPGHTEYYIVRQAQTMNLAKDTFSGRRMLKSVLQEKYEDEGSEEMKQTNDLYTILEESCRKQASYHAVEIESFTWTRLLAPEKVPQYFPQDDIFLLVEYSRICLPLLNPETRAVVAGNVKRNMSLGKHILGGLKSIGQITQPSIHRP